MVPVESGGDERNHHLVPGRTLLYAAIAPSAAEGGSSGWVLFRGEVLRGIWPARV